MRVSSLALMLLLLCGCGGFWKSSVPVRDIVVAVGARQYVHVFSDGTRTNTTRIGNERLVAYNITRLIRGVCTNETVVVRYFANSEPPSGLPTNALLVLERAFFPFAVSSPDEYWVLGGDAFRGVFTYDGVAQSTLSNIVSTCQVSTPKSERLSQESAIGIAKRAVADLPVVQCVKRYAFGWLIELASPPQEVYGTCIVIVGDEGIVKEKIGGM